MIVVAMYDARASNCSNGEKVPRDDDEKVKKEIEEVRSWRGKWRREKPYAKGY